MSCAEIEVLLAGESLSDQEARCVREHCALCESCREFARALAETRAALGSLRQHVLEEAALLELRRRIRRGIAAPSARASALSWRLGLAACILGASAVIGLVFFLGRRSPDAPWPPPPPTAPVVAEAPLSDAKSQVPKAPRARKKPGKAASEELVVKFVTDDPNVVIIWLVDKNGGSP